MGKSEAGFGFAAELKKTQEDLAKVTEALTTVLTMPKRKASTGINIIPFQKSEADAPVGRQSFAELKKNPAALHAELKKMTSCESTLKKSERDLVTGFYCHQVSVDELAPLFAEPKK
jgi:hypothetical protein